jgi:hypothetical protein
MRLTFLFFILWSNSLFGQTFSGIILNSESNSPVEFVNIGIKGENIGTTSDSKGHFTLSIDSLFDNDSLLFSSVGFSTFMIRVADFKNLNSWNIQLPEKNYGLDEVVIRPTNFREKVLGVTSQSNKFQAGFSENQLGYELGVLLKVKKSAFLKKVEINIASCTYDSIFYRLNIYRVKDKKLFENILHRPIYINLQKSQVSNKISINLIPENILVDGDFLITLEHVKDLGSGKLFFSAGLSKKTHYRKTSQGEWQKSPIGISISVIADLEK